MRKIQYLECEDVRKFIDWLRRVARNEDGYSFTHSYEMETKGKSNRTIYWECESLFDAYRKYSWPFNYFDYSQKRKIKGESWDESKIVLDSLKKRLNEAIKNDNNEDCFEACLMILEWGGVLGDDNRGNKKKINELKSKLCDYLRETRNLFESENISLRRQYKIIINKKEQSVIMSAGFTKIYSLLCKDFIIYDGRVGATLGFLVRKYCEDNSLTKIPSNLDFYYGRAQNASVNRNPSNKKYQFKSLSSSSPVHIKNNLKANWIIQKLLDEDCGEFGSIENPLRSFESALFMIGYRISS